MLIRTEKVLIFAETQFGVTTCSLERDHYPANIYLFKVNTRNTRKTCEICSKLKIGTPERRQ